MRIKIMAVSAMCLLLCVCASAQINWIGAGDGVSWTDAANWSTGVVPVATDDVVLDNSTITVSYDVNLPADGTNVTVNSITINPLSPSIIRLLVPAANSANPSLNITATGDALVLHAGGFFSNASSGNIDIDGNLILTGAASVDLSSGTGSPTVSVKGNISVGAANSITESGTGNPILQLNGLANQTLSSFTGAFSGNNLDVVVNSSATVRLLTNVGFPHNLFVQAGTIDISSGTASTVMGVKGNLTIQGTITESGTGVPRLTLNGTANQNITVLPGGTLTGDNLEFRLNNAAGATLQSDLVLPYSYSIAAGNLTLGNFSMTTTSVQYIPLVPAVAPATNHIITNGTGFLIIPNVVSNATFSIGADATSVNEVYIANGEGLTYSIRVNVGINPAISLPLYAINRTWTINTNAVPVNPINVNFYYYPGQGTPNFNYADNIDIGQYTPSAWSIIRNNILPAHDGDANIVAALITSFNTPFVVGNHGAILPIEFPLLCKVQKKEGRSLVNFTVATVDNVDAFVIEKSVNGSEFKSITSVTPVDKKLSYDFTDNAMSEGNTLYRVKVKLIDGKPVYSNIVAINVSNKFLQITSLAPNPVRQSTVLTVSSPGNVTVKMSIYDLQGKLIRQWQQQFRDGTNTVTLQLGDLRNGIYLLSGTDGNFRMNVMKIVKE